VKYLFWNLLITPADSRGDRAGDAGALTSRRVFTDRDWLQFFGHPGEKVFTPRLWLRFAALLLAVVAMYLTGVFVRFAVQKS
jgi:hypothetical protein